MRLNLHAARWLALIILLAPAAPARAGIRDIESANNQISAQFLSQDMSHTETANGTVLNTEDAHIRGYGLSGSVMKNLWLGHDYFAVEYSAAYGQSDYVGGTFGNPAFGSYIGKSGARVEDFDVRYGNGYLVDDGVMLTPYGELGRHTYDRTLGYGTPNSYLETYTHEYFGLGIRGQICPGDSIVWSADALIGRTFGANIVVALPAPAGFSARLGNSAFYKVGTSLDYAFAVHLHASLAVDLASWKYGASALQPLGAGFALYEPDSKASTTMVKAGIGYSF